MTRDLTVLLAVDESTRGLTEDDRHLASALERHGAGVEALVWGQDVPAEAVVVVRSTWDYIERPAHFWQWLDRLEAAHATVHNPVRLLRWNMHKRYLVELAGNCQDLAFAHSIGLTNRTGRVSAGFDRVIVHRPTTGMSGQVGCSIRTIRPINTQVVKESKSDMGEIEATERDPSIPDEPPDAE